MSDPSPAPVPSTSAAPPPPAPTPTPAPAAAPAPAPTPAPVASTSDAPAPSATPAPAGDGLTQAELRKKLDGSRRDLRGYLDKKKRIDRELANLEASIHAFEGSYLSDALLPASSAASAGSSSQFGNIIKGCSSLSLFPLAYLYQANAPPLSLARYPFNSTTSSSITRSRASRSDSPASAATTNYSPSPYFFSAFSSMATDESYLKPGPSAGGDRKRGRVGEEARDADRMFSRSSATFQKALDMRSTDIIESASEEESTGTGRKKRKH